MNTQTGCIDSFEMMTKNLTMEDIKVIFEKMLKEHEASIVQKNQEMFHKQEQSVLELISGKTSLTNQRIDSLSKDMNDLKESLKFSQNEYHEKLKNMGNKVQKLEEEEKLMMEELHVIQTTKPSWAIETDAKLIDLEDPSQNNLRFEGIKEHENESWEDCENKIYDLLENKLEMDIENVVIERAHRTGKKNKNRSRPIVAQFSFYKDKMNILKNCKKLKNTRFSIYEDFSRETAAIRKEKWQEVLANREKGMISYLNYRTVICKQRVQ